MKKILLSISICLFFSSCATILGGKVTDYQKTKPLQGQKTRQIRIGALIADLLTFPFICLPIDFATSAIYKPQNK